jgi:hypothetical protein
MEKKMDNYHIMPLKTDDFDFIWCVMETSTDQLIKAFEFEEEAEEYCDFLNEGGAFDGWTPPCILQEVVLTQDLNREFSSFLSA